MKKPLYFNQITILAISITITTLPISAADAVNTHIQTDRTLSEITVLNIDAPGSGQLYTLTEANGQISSNNLFYSFSHFNIGTTDTVWFNLSTPELANVISRVSGGSESIISGQLKMTNMSGTPNFFFINPAGITFGEGASVDVPGAFYASTASNLNFSDGSQYPANATHTSTLSSASPESFGFLGNEAGNINIVGSETNSTVLTFKPGTEVVFVANHLQIDNAKVNNSDPSQDGFSLQLIATGNEEANIKPGMFANQATAGNLTINNSHIEASGNGSGHLAIQSGNLTVKGSNLFVNNAGDISMAKGHGVDLLVKSNSAIDSSSISSNAMGEGVGGGVFVISDSLSLVNGGQISTSTSGSGDAGNVSVLSRQIDINGQKSQLSTGISSTSEDGSYGNPGNILIAGLESNLNEQKFTKVEKLNITNDGAIKTLNTPLPQSCGLCLEISSNENQGLSSLQNQDLSSINIFANSLVLTNNGSISTNTAEGDAGLIRVVADTINLNNGGSIESSTLGGGNAGSVYVHANQIEINAGRISTDAYQGNNEECLVDGVCYSNFGSAGFVRIEASTLNLMNGGLITSETFNKSTENGFIQISADLLNLHSGGSISSSTFGRSDAGTVVVQARKIDINKQNSELPTGIFSNAENSIDPTFGKVVISLGNAGNIFVVGLESKVEENKFTDIEVLNITLGGSISSSTFGRGGAGGVQVNARQIDVSGQGSEISTSSDNSHGGGAGAIFITAAKSLRITEGSAISSKTDGPGRSFDGFIIHTIDVDANSLELTKGGSIDSSTFGIGDAGAIEVSAKQININEGKIVSSAVTGSSGVAGNITIDFKESLYLDSTDITTDSWSGEKAGTIDINGGNILYLRNSKITTTTHGPSGNGGDININRSNYLILNTGFIQANADKGDNAGDINIDKSTIIVPSNDTLLDNRNTSHKIINFESMVNVIQSVAPDGLIGVTNFTPPQLNLSGILTSLVIETFDPSALNRNMCTIDESSSLMQSGKGSKRPRAKDFLLSPPY